MAYQMPSFSWSDVDDVGLLNLRCLGPSRSGQAPKLKASAFGAQPLLAIVRLMSHGVFLMTISPSALSAVQQAGQSLYDACQAVAAEMPKQAEYVVSALANQPFNPETDQAYANLRAISRLSHENAYQP